MRRVIAVASILVASVTLPAAAQDAWQQHTAAGEWAFRQGDLGRAEREFRSALEIAQTLKTALPIALFTNNADLVRHGLEALWPAVLAPFMPRVFSADLGLTKPDPRAYLRIAELLGRVPEEILVIDDAPVNTATAESLGFSCIDYRSPESLCHALAARGMR